MIKLELMIGHLGDTPFLARHELSGKSIPQYFLDASSGDIALVSNTLRIEWTRRFNANAYSLDLHYALNALIANVRGFWSCLNGNGSAPQKWGLSLIDRIFALFWPKRLNFTTSKKPEAPGLIRWRLVE